jgi:hypothetical protein
MWVLWMLRQSIAKRKEMSPVPRTFIQEQARLSNLWTCSRARSQSIQNSTTIGWGIAGWSLQSWNRNHLVTLTIGWDSRENPKMEDLRWTDKDLSLIERNNAEVGESLFIVCKRKSYETHYCREMRVLRSKLNVNEKMKWFSLEWQLWFIFDRREWNGIDFVFEKRPSCCWTQMVLWDNNIRFW